MDKLLLHPELRDIPFSNLLLHIINPAYKSKESMPKQPKQQFTRKKDKSKGLEMRKKPETLYLV